MAENEFTKRKLLYFVNCSGVPKIRNDFFKKLKNGIQKERFYQSMFY